MLKNWCCGLLIALLVVGCAAVQYSGVNQSSEETIGGASAAPKPQ